MSTIKFILIALSVLIFVGLYSFLSLGKPLLHQAPKINKRFFFTLFLLFIVLTLVFFVTLYFRNIFPAYRVVLLGILALFFFFLLLSLSLIFTDIASLIVKKLSLNKLAYYIWFFKTRALLWVCLFLVLFAYIFHFYTFTKVIPVHITKDVSVKKEKIVVISDLHLGYLNNRTILEYWVKKINQQKPSFVIMLGDFVDTLVDPLIKGNVLPVFNQIQAPVYGVLGNHDSIDKQHDVGKYISGSKIKLLQDETLLVNHKFLLIGRKDAGFREHAKRKTLSEIIGPKDLSSYVSILMDHQPPKNYKEIIHQYPQLDFILSGHTHGGQVIPFSWVNHFLFSLNRGHILQGNTHFIVTQGVGTSDAFPFRLGTESEMIILEFQ